MMVFHALSCVILNKVVLLTATGVGRFGFREKKNHVFFDANTGYGRPVNKTEWWASKTFLSLLNL